MKKQSWFLLLSMWMLAAGSMFAQFSYVRHLDVKVPFEFMAGDTMFPAGHYKVGPMTEQVLLIQGDEDRKITVAHAVERREPSDTSKLVFHKYGERYILTQIWVQGETRGRELPKSALEKELASGRRAEAVAVVASK